MCAKFEKNVCKGFRDTSFLYKFKVALNPMYRFFKEAVKTSSLPIEKKKKIKNRNFHRAVYTLLTLNGPK